MKSGRFISILFLCIALCTTFAGAIQDDMPSIESKLESIRSWMHNDFEVPNSVESPGTVIGVVLRHHGSVLGQGTGSTLQQASGDALKELRRQKIFQRELPALLRQEILDSISIELEICDTFVPSPHKNIDHFEHSFVYGDNGIAVRLRGKTSYRLPCILRLAPHRNIANITESLCIDVGVHPTIALSHNLPMNADITLYTLPCKTYFQNKAHGNCVSLLLGDEPIGTTLLVPSTLLELSDALASHLIVSSGSGSVIGGYQPETDTFTSIFATHFVQLLTANALYSYAQVEGAQCSTKAKETASAILESIASDVRKSNSFDIESASLLLILLNQTGIEKNDAVQELETNSKQLVLQTVLHSTQAELTEMSPFILALLCAATFELETTSENPSYELSSSLCALSCSATTPANRASLIPWVIHPMLAFEKLKPGSFAKPLLELLELAKVSQVTATGLHEGGFLLQTNDGMVVDARGLRMIPMLAKLCHWNAGNPSTSFQALSRSIGFVEQLSTRKERANRFSNPAMALGGIRKSSWDAAMPTEATAMALIGVVEALRTIENIESTIK